MSKSNIVCFPLLEISNDRLKPLQYQLSLSRKITK